MSEQTATGRWAATTRTLDVAPFSTPVRRGSDNVFVLARVLADASALATAGIIATAWTPGTPLGAPLIVAISVASLIAYAFSGLYLPPARMRPLADIRPLLAVPAVVTMIAAAGALALGRQGIGDEAVRLWLLAATFTVAARLGIMSAEQAVRRNTSRTRGATLIVGAGRIGHLAAQRLLDDPALGLRPVGFLDKEPLAHDEGLVMDTDLPVLGASWDLEEVVRSHGIEHVLVAFSTAPNHVVLEVVRRCWRLGVSVMVVPRLFEVEGVRAHTEHLGALPLVSLSPSDPHGWMFSVKYALDRVVAFGLLVVTAPVFALVTVAVLLSSGRPLFFRQRRVGRDGHVFEMLKFRTMSGAPETSGELDADWAAMMTGEAQPSGNGSMGAADDRRTPVGSLLRRTSIDELPQLWNVLRGDMSMIGPRPERLHYVELFEQSVYRYPERHRVKSGLTGWAQIHGLRGSTSLADRIEWDNFYIENWSPWLDLKILVKTIPALLTGRGAR